MKIGPYIGIRGFMSLAEVVHCNNTFCNTRERIHWMLKKGVSGLKFMVGVLVSSKTLAGGTNKYPNRYPPIVRIPEIFSLAEPHLLRTIHYNTDDVKTLVEQVDQLMSIAPSAIDAIQLNIRWPSPYHLQVMRTKYPDLRIILQIGAGALGDITDREDIRIGSALRPYGRIVDDFLVDPSGDKGEPLDVWHAFACLADPGIPRHMCGGVAGGREGDNVRELKGLKRRCRTMINIDAEDRLRTPRVNDGGDHLDLTKADCFLEAGVPLMDEAFRGQFPS